MSAVPLSSAQLQELRAKPLPLRAGTVSRRIGPLRERARKHGAVVLDAVAVEFGVSNAHIGVRLVDNLKTADRAGAQARAGNLVVSAGELADLLPLNMAVAALLDLALDRLSSEVLNGSADEIKREEWRRVHQRVVTARGRVPSTKEHR